MSVETSACPLCGVVTAHPASGHRPPHEAPCERLCVGDYGPARAGYHGQGCPFCFGFEGDIVLFVGTRSLTPAAKPLAYRLVAELASGSLLVSGGATGPDSWGEAAARTRPREIFVELFYPHYQKLGRQAPLHRDEVMAERCRRVIALWDGQSGGTAYTMGYARHLGKPVTAYSAEGRTWDLDKLLRPWRPRIQRQRPEPAAPPPAKGQLGFEAMLGATKKGGR